MGWILSTTTQPIYLTIYLLSGGHVQEVSPGGGLLLPRPRQAAQPPGEAAGGRGGGRGGGGGGAVHAAGAGVRHQLPEGRAATAHHPQRGGQPQDHPGLRLRRYM